MSTLRTSPARRLLPLALLLLTGGCASAYAQDYAPDYPSGYDEGFSDSDVIQPGDLFGGQNVASIELFFGPLEPHGRWVNSRFGRSFRPDAPRDWRPYVNGRWGDNRLWISDDPWGWATDHYGRWGFDERIGWVWVPDTEWAPSWVAWREAGDVTGWAPIPPGIRYSIGIGFGGGFGYDDWNSWYGPSWVWVQRSHVYQRGFGGGILPWHRGQDYWRGSRWNYRSGWNGRPGYDSHPGWRGNSRFGGASGRPGQWTSGRPGQWNARPGQGRPGVGGSIGGGNIGGGRPGTSQPQVQPGQWQGRPESARPDRSNWQGRERPNASQPQGESGGSQWQGRRGPGGGASGGEAIGGGVIAQPVPQPQRQPDGARPDGGGWQGGRGWQGRERPNASQPQGQSGGSQWQGRRGPGGGASGSEAIGGGMIAQPVPQRPEGGRGAGMGDRPAPSMAVAPSAERPAEAPRAERQRRGSDDDGQRRGSDDRGQRRGRDDDGRDNGRPQ